MTRTFIQTEEFSHNWDKLGFNDDDLRRLESEIMDDPAAAPVMQGTGGLRKLRFAHGNQGKSGGVRVCYVDLVIAEAIYLVTVYPKSEKDNLSPEERNNIKKAIKRLKAAYGEKRYE